MIVASVPITPGRLLRATTRVNRCKLLYFVKLRYLSGYLNEGMIKK